MSDSPRATKIRESAKALGALASELSQTIKSPDAKEYFLHLPMNWLSDVEGFLLNQAARASNPRDATLWLELAEWQLGIIESKLRHAQDAVTKYGPDVQLIGL